MNMCWRLARHAAEAVVEAYGRGGRQPQGSPDMSAIVGLADDLRHLEALTRGSEERTQQTFESLHRTMVQIADRLDRMETGFARAPQRPLLNEPDYQPEPVRPPMAAAEPRAARQEATARVLERATEELMSHPPPRRWKWPKRQRLTSRSKRWSSSPAPRAFWPQSPSA